MRTVFLTKRKFWSIYLFFLFQSRCASSASLAAIFGQFVGCFYSFFHVQVFVSFIQFSSGASRGFFDHLNQILHFYIRLLTIYFLIHFPCWTFLAVFVILFTFLKHLGSIVVDFSCCKSFSCLWILLKLFLNRFVKEIE